MDQNIWYLIVTAFTLWSYKIVTILVGYLFAKLGYNLLIKGISGEFKFKGEIKGFKADLVSASPGIFFILMGTIIVGIMVFKGLSLKTDFPDIVKKEEKLIEKRLPEFRPLPKINEKEDQ